MSFVREQKPIAVYRFYSTVTIVPGSHRSVLVTTVAVERLPAGDIVVESMAVEQKTLRDRPLE